MPETRPRLDRGVLLAVFVGGCLGGLARHALTEVWPGAAPELPWPVLVANLLGAFALPVVVVVAAEVSPSRYLRPLLGTGVCGALTTFSAVVVTTDQLLARGRTGPALAYLALTVAGGLAAAVLGLAAGRLGVARLSRPRGGRT